MIGESYFPLIAGQSSTYSVQLIEYKITGEVDSTSYMLREVVADTFTNEAGEKIFILNRYKRSLSDDAYSIDSVWSIRRTNNQIIKVENNIPFVKLTFPVRESTTWDGNIFNTKEEEIYSVSFEQDSAFGDVLRVLHSSIDDTIVFQDQRFERYANELGLVEKSMKVINYCTEAQCFGTGQIDYGFIYNQKIVTE